MCKTYHTIGSLTTLKSKLHESNIHDFKSLKEVIDFQDSYQNIRQELISHHKNIIEKEIEELNAELAYLTTEVEKQKKQAEKENRSEIEIMRERLNVSLSELPKNIFQKIILKLKNRLYQGRIKHKEDCFEIEVSRAIKDIVDHYSFKNSRHKSISSDINGAIRQSAQYALAEIERKKARIDELNTFILGALGEQKVVKVLESLSDDFHLINDFSASFTPALYSRKKMSTSSQSKSIIFWSHPQVYS